MIPIFRAKKIDRDEYIEGYFLFQEKSRECIEICQIYNTKIRATYEVDKTTLSIHFHDMIDSNGNKIFASLQEDGRGGDIFILGDIRLKYIAMIRKNQLMAKQQGTYGSFIGQGYATVDKWKSIGIQQ